MQKESYTYAAENINKALQLLNTIELKGIVNMNALLTVYNLLNNPLPEEDKSSE